MIEIDGHMLDKHGMSARHIADAVRQVVARKGKISS
jgi:hypothetical protein